MKQLGLDSICGRMGEYMELAARARASKKIEGELMQVFNKTVSKWKTLVDKYLEYPEKEMEMRMIVKIKNE